ncbi:MAG: hypothetical protein ABL958_00320 [Bdellovibrionia bacterium]
MRLVGLSLVVLSLVTAAQGRADVMARNPNATHYVRVTPVNGLVRFEFCDKANTSCKLLGKRDYSAYELRALRGNLCQTGTAVLVVDAALLAGAAVYGLGGGAVLGAAIGISSTQGIYLAAYTGSAVAVGSTGHFLRVVKFLNPLRRFKEARSIRSRVASDKDATAWNIERYAKRLDSTLLLLN